MFGSHASYIIPAYAVTFAVIAGLVIWLRLQYAARSREIEALEKSGLSRRSAKDGNQI